MKPKTNKEFWTKFRKKHPKLRDSQKVYRTTPVKHWVQRGNSSN